MRYYVYNDYDVYNECDDRESKGKCLYFSAARR